jgi:predicted amidohydrolase YtcJ
MPNLILYNANVIPQDSAYEGSTAVAIRDNRFLAVGSDDEILDLAGSATKKIDLEGSTLMPGLTESHIHFFDHAMGPKRLQLADSTSLADLRQRLRDYAAMTSPGDWILGQGWNETRWSEQVIPTRHDLDQAAPDHPAILWRSDMHLAIANSLALEKAGITAKTPDPPQGRIDRDASGEPSGGLLERAINMVRDLAPLPSEREVLAAMQESFTSMHRYGITSIHDMRGLADREAKLVLNVFTQLSRAGHLRLRTWMNIAGEHLEQAISLGLRTGYGDSYLRLGHVKFFSDGSQGAHTAWMLEPYLDSDDCGMPLTSMEEIEDAIQRAHKAGLAVTVHAIGDRATRELVDVYERVSKSQTNDQVGLPTAPHRIEHVQNIRPEDLARMSALNVVASVQPVHLADDITLIDQTVGARGRFAYPLRDIFEADVVMAFGSDAPVADHNPYLGLHAATARQRLDGTPDEGWYPDQRLSLHDALWCYTTAPHIATGRQDELGSIAPGYLADAAVIEGDLLKTAIEDLPETKVHMTIFDGRIVYEA